jgi:hypothetical protein
LFTIEGDLQTLLAKLILPPVLFSWLLWDAAGIKFIKDCNFDLKNVLSSYN